MTLGEAFNSALKIAREYSRDGEALPDDYNGQADEKLRMFTFADMAQKELARTAAKIKRSFQVTRVNYENIAISADHNLHLNHGEDIVFTGKKTPRAFRVEVDNTCAIKVVVNGIEKVYTVADPPDGFLTIKDTIDAEDGAEVSLILAGEYPFGYRNVALYAEKFRTADDIPEYTAYYTPDVPGDVWQYKSGEITYTGKNADITTPPYKIEDAVLYLRGDMEGEWNIRYFALPQDITEATPPEYVFEIPAVAHDAIPLKMAYLRALDSGNVNSSVLIAMKNEYAQAVNSITDNPYYTMTIMKNAY